MQLDMYLIVVVATLLVVIVLQAHQTQKMRSDHTKERAELLDRIMSKSLTEYKEQTAGEPPKFEPVDVDDEKEWAREIEMMKSG